MTPLARIRDPFGRAQRLSKTAGKEPPGPNRTLGRRRRRSSRFQPVPAPLPAPVPAREISAAPLEPGFPAPLVSAAGRFNLRTGCAQLSLSVSFAESPARIPSKLNRKMITAAAVLSMSGTVRLWDSRYCMQIGARVTAAASTRWLFFLKPLHDPLTARTRPALSGSRIVSGARRCGSGHALPAVRYIVDEFPRKCRMVNQEAWEAG